MGARDENERLLDGTLPFDIEDDVVPMKADTTAVRKTMLRLVGDLDDTELPVPTDRNAESAVVATLMWYGAYAPTGPITLASIHGILDSAEAFYSPGHRAIFEAIERVVAAGRPPDPIAVHSELVQVGLAKVAGGMEYLDQLVGSVSQTTTEKIRGYATSVRDAWIRRRLLELGEKVSGAARAGGVKPLALIEEAQHKFAALASTAVDDGSFVRLSTCLADMVRRMVEQKSESIPTGLRDLDDLTGGQYPKETTLIAALTSVGKSTLAAQMAIAVTENPKLAVLYVTLEMPAEDFASRVTSQRARVDHDRVRRKTTTADERQRLLQAAADIKSRHIYFASSRQQTIVSIHALAFQLQGKLAPEGVRLAKIVIDTVTLVKPSPAAMRGSREQQVAETSRGLAWLASEFNCHVEGLVHIRRGWNEGGKKKMPTKHDLRESGALENDANNVWILHRELDDYGMGVPGEPAFLGVVKARNGKTNLIQLGCELEFCQFTDWS